MNLSTCTSTVSLSSGLNLGRSLSECLGKGCCIPGTTTSAVLNQGSFGLGGGLDPPPTGTFPAIGLLSEPEELSELDDLGLSGGDSGGEGG